MEEADLERARQLFEAAVRKLLPGTPVDQVELLQYGDKPEIEPGELFGQIILPLPEGTDPADKTARRQALIAFRDANPGKLAELAKAFGARKFGEGIYPGDGGGDPVDSRGPALKLTMKLGTHFTLGNLGGPPADQRLTAVMARLDPEDLQTLDTLIAAGIAGSRAEAVRWTIARIRERPAFEQLRARAQEIEKLKSQF
ncbi:MAG TPA: hypothetical protein VGD91_14795 [Trebonia sp.]